MAIFPYQMVRANGGNKLRVVQQPGKTSTKTQKTIKDIGSNRIHVYLPITWMVDFYGFHVDRSVGLVIRPLNQKSCGNIHVVYTGEVPSQLQLCILF